MKVLFIMDPLVKIHPEKDSTYLLIREALARKCSTYYCQHTDLFFLRKVFAKCQEIKFLKPDEKNPAHCVFSLSLAVEKPTEFFDVILMRTDPPVDLRYFSTTYLLDLAAKDSLVLNNPAALKNFNEKFYGLHFPQFSPPTLVSRNKEQIEDFLKAQGGDAILKPFYASGGEGIFRLRKGDTNQSVIIEQATQHGQSMTMVQKFLPAVKKGDKRIILIDGEFAGAVLRVAPRKDHRSNIHVGGRVKKTRLTKFEQTLCRVLGPVLKKEGLFFVGLDVIGDRLTEINVTSPTGFQEINRLEKRTGSSRMEAIFFDHLQRQLTL